MANPQFQCHNCVHKNSRNQLKGSNGHCLHCRAKMKHNSWWGGNPTISQVLSLPTDDDQALRKLAQDTGLDVKDIITAAVADRVRYWLENPEEVEKRVKQDLMLTKLYRR